MSVQLGPGFPQLLEALLRAHGPGGPYCWFKFADGREIHAALWALDTQNGELYMQLGDGSWWKQITDDVDISWESVAALESLEFRHAGPPLWEGASP